MEGLVLTGGPGPWAADTSELLYKIKASPEAAAVSMETDGLRLHGDVLSDSKRQRQMSILCQIFYIYIKDFHFNISVFHQITVQYYYCCHGDADVTHPVVVVLSHY